MWKLLGMEEATSAQKGWYLLHLLVLAFIAAFMGYVNASGALMIADAELLACDLDDLQATNCEADEALTGAGVIGLAALLGKATWPFRVPPFKKGVRWIPAVMRPAPTMRAWWAAQVWFYGIMMASFGAFLWLGG